jgi:hypothetical protein
MKRLLLALSLAVVAGVLGFALCMIYVVEPLEQTNPVPRCVNDDFNDGSQTLCYTIDQDARVIVIDMNDEVVS